MGGQDKGARTTSRARRQFQRSAIGLGIEYGNGITYDEDNYVMSIDIGTDSGLEFVSGQLEVFVDPDDGLEKNPTGLGVKLPASSGLATTANGLAIDLRDNTPCLELSASGVGTTVKIDGGIQRTSDGLALVGQSGTSFPTANLFVGQQFFRTDLVQMFTYDGIAWVGDIYTLLFGRNTGSFAPTGTNAINPQASVSSSPPYGYGNQVDTKLVGLQFNCGGSWSGTVNVYYGPSVVHSEVLSGVYGFNRDLNIDLDAHTRNGIRIELVVTSGLAFDPICVAFIRRRIDPV